MRFLLRVMLIVFGLLLVVSTGVITILRRDAVPPSWIAFVSEDYELYRMNPDGRGVVQLTHTSEREWYPTWSPDGRWIAYTTSLVYEDFNVYLIRANGTRIQQLNRVETGSNYSTDASIWTPDGKCLLFGGDMFSPGIHRNCPEKHIDEEIVNNLCYFRGLGWLPDGEHLIFSAEQVGDSGFEVYKMRADGKELQRVILEPWSGHCCVGSPVLSPDRRSIIIHNMDIRSSDVHIVDLDTATSYPLTSSLDIGSQLSWSPDGQWITFTVRENGSGEIYRVHPDGTEFQRITQNQIYEVDPVWSPDGQWILFRSSWSATLRQDIYRIRPDGSDLQRLTDNSNEDQTPSWSPPIRVPFHPILSIILGITCLLGGSMGRLPKIER